MVKGKIQKHNSQKQKMITFGHKKIDCCQPPRFAYLSHSDCISIIHPSTMEIGMER
jgi:hypothetical protein